MKQALSLLLLLNSCVLFGQVPRWGLVFDNSNSLNVGFTARALLQHPNGDVYLGGGVKPAYYNADIDPGPGTQMYYAPGTNEEDALLTRFDSLGNFQQVTVWPGNDVNEILYLEAAPNGDLIVGGVFKDTVDFDPGPGTFKLGADHSSGTTSAFQDIFVQRLTPSGQMVWTVSFYGSGRDELWGMELDAQGNIYLAGEYYDSLDVDPGPGVNQLVSVDVAPFLVKLDPAGNLLWARHSPGGQYMTCEGLALDEMGNPHLAGTFQGTVDFDPGPGTTSLSHTNGVVFVQKFDPSGNLDWATQLAANGVVDDFKMSLDSAASVYLVGTFGGNNVDFDPGPGTFGVTQVGPYFDGFVCKFDSSRTFQWAKRMEANNLFELRTSDMTRSGDWLITGKFSGTVDFDPGIGLDTHSVGGSAPFLQRLNSDGELVVAHHFEASTSLSPEGSCVYWDGGEDFFWGGTMRGTTDFDPGADSLVLSPPSTGWNPFVVAYSEDTCSTLTLNFDSVFNATCVGPGTALALGSGGAGGFSFLWSDGSINPMLNFTQSGVYTAFLTDSLGCSRSRSLLLEGPPLPSGLDRRGLATTGAPFPGGNFPVWLRALNEGCQATSGEARFTFDGPVSLYSSSILADSTVGDTLWWDLDSLSYDSLPWNSILLFLTDTTATIGDSVCFEWWVGPLAGDTFPGNNLIQWCVPVVNSYDPNDKQVLPQGACADHYVLDNGDPLTYTVRFQNTGTAAARRVYILDTLSTLLDFASVRVLDHSHPMYTEVLPGGVLRFVFEDIQLLPADQDWLGSQGYVTFEVTPDAGQAGPGDRIENRAGIYFDFNAPIITNAVFNTLIDSIPLCFTVAVTPEKDGFRCYPNPSRGRLVLENDWLPGAVRVDAWDLNGRQVFSREYADPNRLEVEIEGGRGLYLLRVQEANGRQWVRKILLE